MNPFKCWLVLQRDRKDRVGRVARVVAKLPPGACNGPAPFGAVVGALWAHQRRCGANTFAALQAAHREWLALRRRIDARRDALAQHPIRVRGGLVLRVQTGAELRQRYLEATDGIHIDE